MSVCACVEGVYHGDQLCIENERKSVGVRPIKGGTGDADGVVIVLQGRNSPVVRL